MKLAISALLFLFSIPLAAEPGPTARWLMDEPATMMDLGTSKLEAVLLNRMKVASVSVAYDWDANRIRITYVETVNGENAANKKQMCAKRVRILRQFLGINSRTGKAVLPNSTSNLARYFGHSGFAPSNMPKNLWQRLDQITEFKVVIASHPGEKDLRCQAPLLGTKILYSE